MTNTPLKPEAIRGLLAHILTGAAGGNESEWRARIGAVEALPLWSHPKCNWRVTPCGSAAEVDAIRRAIELVVTEHPYVS